MGRSGSVGCRAKAHNREAAAALRERLGRVPAHKWQRAQCIMDELAELTGAKGPMGGNMVPRACRYCGFFGHTRQFCKRLKADEEAELERLAAMCDEEREVLRGYELNATERYWKAKFDFVKARFAELVAEKDWCETSCGQCALCAEWRRRIAEGQEDWCEVPACGVCSLCVRCRE